MKKDYLELISLLKKAAKIADNNIGKADNIDLEQLNQSLEDWISELEEIEKFEKYEDED
jgi:hypothetical protein